MSKMIYNINFFILCFVLLTFETVAQTSPQSPNFAIRFGTNSTSYSQGVWDVHIDNNGNTYAAGNFNGTSNFNPSGTALNFTAFSTYADGYIAKYNSSGVAQWAIPFTTQNIGGASTNNSNYAVGVTTDLSGNVYATGMFYGTVDFNPSASVNNLTSNGGSDIFVAKYNSSGQYQWAYKIGGSTNDAGQRICIDGLGNVVIVGYFGLGASAVEFNTTGSGASATRTSNGLNDIFVVKYSSSGSFVQVTSLGGIGNDLANDVKTDLNNNIFVTGTYAGTMTINSLSVTSAGNTDAYLLKLNSNLTAQFLFNLGGTSADKSESLAIDSNNDIIIAGTVSGTAGTSFDMNPSASQVNNITLGVNATENFLAKYDNDGNYKWATAFSGTANHLSRPLGLGTDLCDNIIIGGAYTGTINFNPSGSGASFTSTSQWGAAVAKFSASGNFRWAFMLTGYSVSAYRLAYNKVVNKYAIGGDIITNTTYPNADFDPTGTILNLSSMNANYANAMLALYPDPGNTIPSITLGNIASISSSANNFTIPYTSTTGSPNQYSISTGAPTAISGFTTINNATLPASPISVNIPATAPNAYNFNVFVTNSTTGCNSSVQPITLTINTPNPVISSFSPAAGNVGSTVTITGTNFTSATNVWFGAAPATSFTVVNATTITAVVPNIAYSGTIAVKTPNGFSISHRDFRINNPTNFIITSGSRNYIQKNGKLFANGYAMFGDSSSTGFKNCPVEIPLKGSLINKTISQIAASSNIGNGGHVLVLASDATLHAFGSNNNGQLGTNTTSSTTIPVDITNNGSLAGKTIIQIAAGNFYSVALASDGTVHTWGNQQYGVLGNGLTTAANILLPVNISSNGSLAGKFIIKIAASYDNAFCIAGDSTVHVFGQNYLGSLGIGTSSAIGTPTLLNQTGILLNKVITQIETSANGSIFLTTEGHLYGSGGYLVATGTANTSTPIVIDTSSSSSSLKNKKVLTAKCFEGGAFSIDDNNIIHSWGNGNLSALGNNSTTSSAIPGLVSTSSSIAGKTIYQLGAASNNGTVMTNDTNFHVWGRGTSGILGDGQTTVAALVPKVINLPVKPTLEASNIIFTSSSTTAARIDFTPGNGTNRIVVVKPNNPVNPNAAIDGNTYTANTTLNSGGLIDGTGRVVYNGTGNSVLVTGLTVGTVYHVAVFEYFAASAPCNINYYKLGSAASGSFTAGSLLPLTLLSFNATKNGQQVALNWQTTNELNTAHINVQFSTDGNSWNNIATIYTRNTAGINDYSYLHTTPIKGKNYYRLQQVDKDGKTTYSSIRSVDFNGKKAMISVYPNPIKGNSFTIDLGMDITKPIGYTLYNSIGKLVQQGIISSRQKTITTGILPAGSYLLKLTNGQTVNIIK